MKSTVAITLLFVVLLQSACKKDNAVKVHYTPVANFKSYVMQAAPGRPSETYRLKEDEIGTVYRLTTIENVGQEAEAFLFFVNKVFVQALPGREGRYYYQTGEDGVTGAMYQEVSIDYFLPETFSQPTDGHLTNTIDRNIFIISKYGQGDAGGKTPDDYRNGYYNALHYDNRKDRNKAGDAMMVPAANVKPVYYDELTVAILRPTEKEPSTATLP